MNRVSAPWSLSRRRILAFAIGCVTLVIPLWIVRYPPLLDYPNHLASSFVIAHLHDPGVRFSELYESDWSLSPYLVTDALLVGLQRFVSVDLAGRIVLSLCVVGLPLSVWFFAQQRQDRTPAVLWAFPLAYHLFFLAGFVQYCLGMAGCFAVLALWQRYVDRPNGLRWAGLLGAVMLLYGTHVFGFAVAAAAAGTCALARRVPLARLSTSWLVFVPGILLFLSPRTGAAGGHIIVYGSLIRKAEWLLAVLAVHPEPRHPANLVVFALLVVAAVAAWWRNPDFRWDRGWALTAAVLFALYLALPSGAELGTNFVIVDSRLLPFALIMLLMAVDLGRRRRWFSVLVVLIFAVRMVTLTYFFLAEQPRLDRLARAIDIVPANVRLLPIWRSEPGRFNTQIFRPNHFWGYGVIRDGWVAPYLFSSGVHVLHPAHGDPYPPVGDLASPDPSAVDWDRVRKAYDYVWAYRLPSLSGTLGTLGDRVFADEDLEVYKIRQRVPLSHSRLP